MALVGVTVVVGGVWVAVALVGVGGVSEGASPREGGRGFGLPFMTSEKRCVSPHALGSDSVLRRSTTTTAGSSVLGRGGKDAASKSNCGGGGGGAGVPSCGVGGPCLAASVPPGGWWGGPLPL